MIDSIEKNIQLAILGGEESVIAEQKDIFTWPVITEKHEKAVLKVLRNGQMSGLTITKKFENEYPTLLGRKYALASPNGTCSILEAMYGMGIGAGDERFVNLDEYDKQGRFPESSM